MNRIERFSLFLVAAGGALVWLVLSYIVHPVLPEWVYSRFHLYVCAPAVLLGCWSFHQYGGYAKSRMVLLCGLFMSVGILWAESSEQGRGMLIAAGYLVTLPIASLIRKQNYMRQFLAIFALVTALGLLYGMTRPAAAGRWGELIDNTGTHLTNANVLGTQAAIAILAALTSFPRRRLNRIIFAAAMAVLAVACFQTQTRTGILALGGAGLVVVYMRLRHKPALLITAGFVTVASAGCLVAADLAFSNGSVVEGVLNRLLWDDEENVGSLGHRTEIWRFARQQFLEETNWLTGVGTGGADKALGKFYEFCGRVSGRDRIWRLYPHNSLVQNGLELGIFGLVLTVWLAFQIMRNAYRLDCLYGGWQRTAFVVMLGFAGAGGVVQREAYWIPLGSALWAMISADQPDRARREPAPRLRRSATDPPIPEHPRVLALQRSSVRRAPEGVA